VSHFKERAQNNCLNCNAVVHGRFCHICGQENIEPKETVWHLISHFFQDITHFDGKFFSTLKYLLFRPGHLSREYMLGRRASHLNPIRMYVFTSAFFFLFFFSTVKVGNIGKGKVLYEKTLELKNAKGAIADLQKNLAVIKNDSVELVATQQVLGRFEARTALLEAEIKDLQLKDSLKRDILTQKQDSLTQVLQGAGIPTKKKLGETGPVALSLDDLTGFSTLTAYDSVQAQLPANRRDGWWQRLWLRKGINLTERANDKSGGFGKALMDKFFHSLPQMFFLSLPLYAFFLMILYNREKKYYYVNHAIFSIHVFCATFILSFLFILLAKYVSFDSRALETIYNWFFMLAILFYQYKAMRNFYQQRRAKTITKFLILSVVSFLAVMFLAIIFFFISLWNV